jgi:hypothetical protein
MRNALLILALALGGCAVVWDKPGGTESEFHRDEYECQLVATGMGGISGGGGSAGPMIYGAIQRTPNRNIYKSCMRSRGWTQTNTIG